MTPMIGSNFNLHRNYLSCGIAISNGTSCINTTRGLMSSWRIEVWVSANTTFTISFIVLITKSSAVVAIIIVICGCIKSVSPSRRSRRRVGESSMTGDEQNLFWDAILNQVTIKMMRYNQKLLKLTLIFRLKIVYLKS